MVPTNFSLFRHPHPFFILFGTKTSFRIKTGNSYNKNQSEAYKCDCIVLHDPLYVSMVIYKHWYYGQTHIILTFYFRSQSWKDQGQSRALAQSRARISLVVCPFLYIYFLSQFTRNKRKGKKSVKFERAIEQVPNSAQGGVRWKLGC